MTAAQFVKRLAAFVVVAGAMGVIAFFALNRVDSDAGQAPLLAGAPSSDTLLARGEYLTKAADCIACHTVASTGKAFAGGVPFVLPFGTIYSSNITPDPATGIGRWTDEQFLSAVHDGIRSDGQRLYSAFPYTSYTQLSRADVLAIKAYLFSLAPVSQENKKNDLGFPFNQRWAMGFWNAVFFKSQRFVANPAQSAQWNSGAYLATALGHCAECHTPRNIGFGLEHDNELAGSALQGWRAYNITSDREHGIGSWSDVEIAAYLSTGHAQSRGSAGGPMAEAVAHSLQYLKPEDTAALISYLRSVPARAGKNPVSIDSAPVETLASNSEAPGKATLEANLQGMKLFEGACASCHQWNGLGQQIANAGLIGTRGVNDPEGANVTQIILHGVDMRVAGTDVYMPSYAAAYTDSEIASLANFVISHFGNKKGLVTAATVSAARKER